MPNKTEVMWFGAAAKLSKIPPASSSIRVGSIDVQPMTVVRDLGVMIDGELSMRIHVSRTAQTCFYHLRRLRSIRRQLSRDVPARLVSAFVLSRLDYCNAVLAGLPASTLAPFQRVLHAAARLVLNLRPCVGAFEGAALAPSRTTNRLQAVLLSPQVITWSSARVHQQHVEAVC